MTTKTRIAAALLLVAGSGVPLRAASPDEQIAAADAAATAAASTPEGKKLEKAVGEAFGRDHSATVGRCAKAAKRADLRDFDLFLRLDPGGVVQETLVRPGTALSTCVQAGLAGWRTPGSQQAGSWVKIGVKLSRS